jgi:hypothetical protein
VQEGIPPVARSANFLKALSMGKIAAHGIFTKAYQSISAVEGAVPIK